ncbi:unnamed protein product, partial [Meganyctiphanes norvegica]
MNVDQGNPYNMPPTEDKDSSSPEKESEHGINSSLLGTSDMVLGNCETISQCSGDSSDRLSSIDTDAEIQKSDSEVKLNIKRSNSIFSTSAAGSRRCSESRDKLSESLSKVFKKVFQRSRTPSPSPKGKKVKRSWKRISLSRQNSGSSEDDTSKDPIINGDSLQKSDLECCETNSTMQHSQTSDCLNLDTTDEFSNISDICMPKSQTYAALSDALRLAMLHNINPEYGPHSHNNSNKKDCLLEEGNYEDNYHPSIYLSSENDSSQAIDIPILSPTMLAMPYADPDSHSDMSDISDDEGTTAELCGYFNCNSLQCQEAHAHEYEPGENFSLDQALPKSGSKKLVDEIVASESETPKSGRSSPSLQRLRELGEKVKEMGTREMGSRGGKNKEDGTSLQRNKPQSSSFKIGKIAEV